MNLLRQKTTGTFLMMCLLGAAYVAAKIANILQLISYPREDAAKLAIAIMLCVIGFSRGRDFFQFTHTMSIFVVGSLFVIAYHIIQLAKEMIVFHGVPLVARDSAAASVVGETLLIGILCLFLGGILFSVSRINIAKRQLEKDIAERKRAEQALRESESKLKSIFRAAPVGIGLLSNRVLLDVNDRICEMVGYSREELVGRSARMLYATQEDYDYVGREKYGQIRERGTGTVETRWQRKDGEGIDVLLNSTPLDPKDLSKGITFTALDITEHKHMEGALRENKAKLETILNSSPCAIVVSDLEGRVVDANPACMDMFGVLSREEGIGRSTLDFVSPRDRDKARDYVAKTARGGLVRDVEYAFLRGDGSEFIGEVSSNVIRDAAGAPCGFVTVTANTTERKRSENLMKIQHDLAVSLGEAGSLEEGLRLCLQAALNASGLDCGGIYLHDRASAGLYMSCHTGLSEEFVARVSRYDREAINTQMAMSGRPMYATVEELDASLVCEALQALAVIPIIHRGQVIGCLNVASHTLAEVPQYARSVLETIASQISGTIARLEAEEEVRRERELLDRIAGTSQVGITVVDRDGRMKFANPRAVEILGLARDQILQRAYDAPAWHITDYDGKPFPEEQLPFRQVMATRRPVHNIRHAIARPGGRRALLSVNAAPILDDTNRIEGVVLTIDDVTEQVRIEQALRESERQMRLVVEASPLPIHVTRPATGEILLANRATCELFGYDRQEILGKSTPDFYANAAHDRPVVLAELQERGRVVQRELSMRKSDGTAFPALMSLEPVEYERQPATLVVIYDLTERKRAEEALRESEERYRLLLQNANDAVYVHEVSPEAPGRFLEVNERACQLLGYTREELLRMNIPEIDVPEQRACIPAILRQLYDIGSALFETEHLTKDGRRVPVEISTRLFHLRGQPTVLSFVRDITERRRVEKALWESKQRMDLALRGADLGTWDWNVQTGHVVFNERWARMLGYTPDEIRPHVSVWKELIHPDDLAKVMEVLNAHLRGETDSYTTEHRLKHKSGDWVWVLDKGRVIEREADGKPLRACGTHLDITERKHAEEALRESEELFSAVVGQAKDGIVLIQDQHCIFANQALADMLGYRRDELQGKPFIDKIAPESRDLVARQVVARLRGQDAPSVYEARLLGRDGQIIDAELGATVIRHRGIATDVGIVRDITDRKKAEQALARSEEKFSRVFRASPAQIAISRLSDGRMIDVNESLAQASGYHREEILGRTSFELGFWADPEDRGHLTRRIAAEGAVRDYECRFRTRDGRILSTRYSAEVVEIGGEVCLLSAFVDVTARKQVEERLRAHERQLSVLASELALAEERERRRIAGELHDHACQSLVLARMRLDALLATMPAAQAEAFQGINSSLNKTIESVRELTFDLSSPTLYKFGLEAALEELLDDKFRLQKDVEHVFSNDHLPKPLTDDVKVLLFQSVREILINIIKHARAHRISLDIRRTDGSITIAVTDDGVGFDLEEVFSLPARHRGFGLFNIKERLDYIGGILKTSSQRGEGSRFVLVAPLKMEGLDSRRNHDVGQSSAR